MSVKLPPQKKARNDAISPFAINAIPEHLSHLLYEKLRISIRRTRLLAQYIADNIPSMIDSNEKNKRFSKTHPLLCASGHMRFDSEKRSITVRVIHPTKKRGLLSQGGHKKTKKLHYFFISLDGAVPKITYSPEAFTVTLNNQNEEYIRTFLFSILLHNNIFRSLGPDSNITPPLKALQKREIKPEKIAETN